MKQLPDMARMVGKTEFFFDDPRDHRRSPHSPVQAIGDRAAIQNIVELLALYL